MKTVLVSREMERFAALQGSLEQAQLEVQPLDSGQEALTAVAGVTQGMVIIDEQAADMDGLALARQLVQVNPFVNLAMVSAASAEEFHEQTEGLGIFWQLPPHPSAADGQRLLAAWQRINGLLASNSGDLGVGQ